MAFFSNGIKDPDFLNVFISCTDHVGNCYCRYEDDPIIGHRLYREIRKVELKKAKAKGSQVLPSTTYQWETVATNFDEFQDVSVSR